jgi:hypothetical protein
MKDYGLFVSIAVFLLVVLAVGIATRRNGVSEGTEIIPGAFVGIGTLVNAWLNKAGASKPPKPADQNYQSQFRGGGGLLKRRDWERCALPTATKFARSRREPAGRIVRKLDLIEAGTLRSLEGGA